MIITFMEIFDIIVMSLALGFIFKDIFRAPASRDYDPIANARQSKRFFNKDFFFALAVTAPAVILHEFGHKFVAMGLGYNAVFHAASFYFPYDGILLGVVLKLAGSGILFFIPAFVTITPTPPALQSAIISFAGPAVNLILWIASWLVLKFAKKLKKQHMVYLVLTKKINMLLFFFNMIPIGPFDGRKVLDGLIGAISA